MVYGSATQPGEIQAHPEILERARALGERLAKGS